MLRQGANDKGAAILAPEQAISEFLDSIQSEMDDCMESVGPILAIKNQQYRQALVQLKNRGVKIRYITEITPDNIQYCKELMQYADLRHLEGIRGNFAISETKQLILLNLGPDKPVQKAILATAIELVEQQRYLFNVLWSKATPAEQRIKELEEGIVAPQTQVISDFDDATSRILAFLKNAKRDIGVCASSNAPSVIVSFEPYKTEYVEAKRRGVTTRIITEITKNNIQHCKEMMKFAELRHADGIKGNFAVTETEYIASATLEEAKRVIQIIYSNVRQIIDQQKYLFDTLWQKGIPADQKIREIETGVAPTVIEIIPDPHESIKRAHELLGSAEQEVQVIFASLKAFRRFVEVGALKAYGDAANRGVRIRVLAPANNGLLPLLEEAKSTILQNADVRIIDESLQTGLPTLIVDKRHVMIWELKDDAVVDNFSYALGRATYSNSDSIVNAYSSIYEVLWRQTDLYSQLEAANRELMHNTEELRMAFDSLAEMNRKILKANEELKVHDKMQSEFIKIAAHELRTPVQPLLGVADLLSSQFEKEGEMVEVPKSEIEIILRNASRLERLSSDILQVSRIESQSLKLYKETFDINNKIKGVLSDMRASLPKESQLKIVFQPYATSLLVHADKIKIFEVISNILRNAIKFTEDGVITVSCDKSADDNSVIVSVKDTGTGIDQQMLPKLFTKFAVAHGNNMYDTRTGSGLGLYISRNIVEAHGGKVWAENNKDGKGATFSFTLPLAKVQDSDVPSSS